MTDWSAELEIRGIEPLDDERVDELVDHVGEHAGVVALYPDGYSVQVSVATETLIEALAAANRILEAAAAAAHVPARPLVRAEVVTHEQLDASLAEPALPTLVGVAEVAALLDVSRQRVSELRRQTHFPAPIADLKSGPVWMEPTLTRFVETWRRRPGRPASKQHDALTSSG